MQIIQNSSQAKTSQVDTTPRLSVSTLLSSHNINIVIYYNSNKINGAAATTTLTLHTTRQNHGIYILAVSPTHHLTRSVNLARLSGAPHPIPNVRNNSLDTVVLSVGHAFSRVIVTRSSPRHTRTVLRGPFCRTLSDSFTNARRCVTVRGLNRLHRRSTNKSP